MKNLTTRSYFFLAFCGEEEVVRLAIEINADRAFIKRIDSLVSNKGYGLETLEAAIDYLKKLNIINISAYIEKGNTKSENMFSKLGFHQTEDGHLGDYWTLDKNILEKMNTELNFSKIT